MRPTLRFVLAASFVLTPFAACRERHDPPSGGSQAPDAAPREAMDASVDADLADADADSSDAGDAASDADADDDAGARSVNGCPVEMARIGRFCVDRWEATLVHEDEGGALVPWPYSQVPDDAIRYEARSAPGAFPQGYVSRDVATRACRAAKKRLCSMDEWRRACEGKRHATYPYGSRLRANACNSYKTHLLSQMFGTNAGAWKYDESFNSPKLLEEPGFLAKTGEYEACESQEGVFDLVGNLHEWVSDVVTQDLVDRLAEEPIERRKQPWREGNGVFMGGFFSTTYEHGPGCGFVTIAHEPRYHDYSIGFRCCRSAEIEPKTKGK